MQVLDKVAYGKPPTEDTPPALLEEMLAAGIIIFYKNSYRLAMKYRAAAARSPGHRAAAVYASWAIDSALGPAEAKKVKQWIYQHGHRLREFVSFNQQHGFPQIVLKSGPVRMDGFKDD